MKKSLFLGSAILGLLLACYDTADCNVAGTTYRDGESWTADNCDICECENGVTMCTASECTDSGDSSSDTGR